MSELVDWLRQQLDEDERVARAATVLPYGSTEWFSGAEGSVLGIDPGSELHVRGAINSLDDIGEHIARWDPARVLAEVEAKRQLLSWAVTWLERDCAPWNTEAIRLLAQPYAGREGYRAEWAV